jgi:hypothetical protein
MTAITTVTKTITCRTCVGRSSFVDGDAEEGDVVGIIRHAQ